MKRMTALVLALIMVMTMVACGNTKSDKPALEGTMEEIANQIIEKNPVEFMGGIIPVDLTDTSEDGLWMVKNYTGLDNADSITEAAFYEPMMGSIPYSMVMVRTAEGADVKAVAEGMKNGIDQR